MTPEAVRKLSEVRDLLERRRRRRRDESVSEMVKRVQVFAKTQGRVVGSYTKRLKAAVTRERAGMNDKQADQVAKVVGLMDQLDEVMRDLEPAAKAVKV